MYKIVVFEQNKFDQDEKVIGEFTGDTAAILMDSSDENSKAMARLFGSGSKDALTKLLSAIATTGLLQGIDEEEIEETFSDSVQHGLRMARGRLEEESAMVLNMFRMYKGAASEIELFDSVQLSEFLADDAHPFRHILMVADRMLELCHLMPYKYRSNAMSLTQATYLQDKRYLSGFRYFGYPHLDGPIFAMNHGYPRHVVAAILFQPAVEQRVATQIPELKRFYEEAKNCLTEEDLLFIRLVTYCDLLTGPKGERVTLDERLREISDRYGADHPVTRYMHEQEPMFRSIIQDVEALATTALTGYR